MMIFMNIAQKKEKITRTTASLFIRLLSPFAPHLAEELWQATGHKESLTYEPWPVAEENTLKRMLVQMLSSPVNGKMRFKIELPVDLPGRR